MARLIFAVAALMCTYLSAPGQINDPREINQEWKTDLKKRNIPLKEVSVLLPRDEIPSIDRPQFLPPDKAAKTYFKFEPVIAVNIEGEARAYPLSVLMWHEIVNDRIGNHYVTVTYCPLCNAAIVFNRSLEFNGNNYLLDFGVSGMLRNSDMIMWDRQTETWWQQILGEGLVGSLQGAVLEVFPSMVISFDDFIKRWPDGKVLSTQNSTAREYGRNPYGYYDTQNGQQPFAFEGEVDSRLPATERVIDICAGEICRVYPWEEIQRAGVIHDDVAGQQVVLFHKAGAVSVMDHPEIRQARSVGSVTVFDPQIADAKLTFKNTKKGFLDKETGSLWDLTGRCIEGQYKGRQLSPIPHGNHFAFAWFAFHPNSEIYSIE